MTQAFCWSCHLSYMCQKQSAFQMSRMKSLQWTADQARWIFTFLFCLFSKTQNLSNAPQWQWQQFAKKHSDNGFLFQWHSEMYAQFNTHKQSAPWMDPQIFLLFFPFFYYYYYYYCLPHYCSWAMERQSMAHITQNILSNCVILSHGVSLINSSLEKQYSPVWSEVITKAPI